jgi:hypothetical protein
VLASSAKSVNLTLNIAFVKKRAARKKKFNSKRHNFPQWEHVPMGCQCRKGWAGAGSRSAGFLFENTDTAAAADAAAAAAAAVDTAAADTAAAAARTAAAAADIHHQTTRLLPVAAARASQAAKARIFRWQVDGSLLLVVLLLVVLLVVALLLLLLVVLLLQWIREMTLEPSLLMQT